MARVVVAEDNGALIGFVTVDPETTYLDQIVVATEYWGSGVALMLLDEAKRISPKGLELLVNKDNARAIRFYEKHGFDYAGEDKQPGVGQAGEPDGVAGVTRRDTRRRKEYGRRSVGCLKILSVRYASVRHTHFPSPLVGEGGECGAIASTSRVRGRRRTRSRTPSPALAIAHRRRA